MGIGQLSVRVSHLDVTTWSTSCGLDTAEQGRNAPTPMATPCLGTHTPTKLGAQRSRIGNLISLSSLRSQSLRHQKTATVI
eukprot:1524114-Amphidinium_carterae.1